MAKQFKAGSQGNNKMMIKKNIRGRIRDAFYLPQVNIFQIIDWELIDFVIDYLRMPVGDNWQAKCIVNTSTNNFWTFNPLPLLRNLMQSTNLRR